MGTHREAGTGLPGAHRIGDLMIMHPEVEDTLAEAGGNSIAEARGNSLAVAVGLIQVAVCHQHRWTMLTLDLPMERAGKHARSTTEVQIGDLEEEHLLEGLTSPRVELESRINTQDLIGAGVVEPKCRTEVLINKVKKGLTTHLGQLNPVGHRVKDPSSFQAKDLISHQAKDPTSHLVKDQISQRLPVGWTTGKQKITQV